MGVVSYDTGSRAFCFNCDTVNSFMEIIAKSYLEEFSVLHEEKLKDILFGTFVTAYAELGLEEDECIDRAMVQIKRLDTKIESWHIELLELTGVKKNG